MGGFNLGELAGVLRLDDSDYRQKLAASAAATQLLTVHTDRIGESVRKLDEQLRSAGFNMTAVQGYLNSLRAQGLTTAGAVNEITASIQRMQAAIVSANLSNPQFKAPGRASAQPTDWNAALEAERQQVIQLMRKVQLQETELVNYRSMMEAERIQLAQIKSRVSAETEYAALKARLRSQELADDARRAAGGRTAVAENARLLAPQIAAEEKYLRDMAKMREFYTAQANTADIAAKAAAEAQKTKIEAEAAAARAEVQRAELAFQERMYLDDVAAAKAAAKAKLLEERKLQAEKAALNRVVTQASYIGGGYVGGHMASLTMFSPTTAAIGGGAVVLALAAKEAANFDKIITQTTANMRGMADDMKNRLSRAVLELSTAYPIAAEEIAKSLKDMKENAYDAQGAMVALPEFVKFAAGTLTPLGAAIEHITSAQKAFRLEGDDQVTNLKNLRDIMNVVTKLNELGGASAEEYAKSLSAVGGEALKLNMSVRDAGAAVRVLALQDVDGSRAGEVLSRVLVTITNAAEKNAPVWRQLGVEIYEANGKLKPFSEVMDQLAKVIGTTDPKLNAFNTNLLGLSTRSDKFVAAFLRQTQALHEGRKALDDVNGAMDRAMSKRVDNLADQWTLAFNNIKKTAIDAAGPINKLLKDTLEYFNAFNSMMNILGTFGSMDASKQPKAVIGKDGKISFPKEEQKAPAPETKAQDDSARSAERAADFTKKYTNDLTILKKELADTNRLIKVYNELLSDPKTSNAVRDAKEPEFEQLRNKRDDLQSRIKALQDEASGKTLGKKMQIEDLKRQLEDFQDQYAEVVSRMDAGQQEVIDKAISRAKQLLSSKADPKLVTDALKSADQDLRQLKRQFAADDKAESAQLAADNAAESVKAFKERWMADMRQFTPAQKEYLAIATRDLEAGVAAGNDPKQIASDLKLVNNQYIAIKDTIQATEEAQRNLDEAQRQYEQHNRREKKERPEILPMEQRVPPQIVQMAAAFRQVTIEGTKVDDAMRGMGLTSQYSMLLAASASAALAAQLRATKASVDEIRTAELAAAADAIRWQEGLKPLAREFTEIRVEMERLRKEGNTSDRMLGLAGLQIQAKALDWQLNGLGKTGTNVLHELQAGWNQLGTTIVRSFTNIKDFGKLWKDTLTGILENVLGAFLQGLINMAGAWIAKSLGLIAQTKLVGVSQVTTAAAIGQANAMASTALIPIVGPALAAAAGEAMYAMILAASLPKLAAFEFGGHVDKTQLAMVHSGEYVATSKLTKGLQALVDNGISGGGGDYFDFRGATFGAGLNQAKVDGMMRQAVGKLRRAGGRSQRGKF